MKRNLHFYDPLYEILFFGDMPTAHLPKGLYSAFRAGSGQMQLKKYIMPFISCPEVARLHWLNQAGFIHLVYPSGSHSRFAHALGTLHLGSIALSSVTVQMNKKENKTLHDCLSVKGRGWVEEFILALFLHDLGHYPFSHTLENNAGLKGILNNELVSHEEVACQLINGNGAIYEAYKKTYKGEETNLVAQVLKDNSGYQRDIICYLISGDERYLSFTAGKNDRWILKIMHDLVSGSYDLDRIDHYRRDSFFTGLGHAFKPYVLLYGLHYKCEDNNPVPKEEPNKEAESQISTLLFIRDQLHECCFGNLINISYGAMLNQALTLHLSSVTLNKKREEALSILTMTDGELLTHLMKSGSEKCRKIILDIRIARPYPCVATFPKEGNPLRDEIFQMVLSRDKSVILGFSKYYDRQEKPWLGKAHEVPDAGKGYVFSKDKTSEAVVKLLIKTGINGVAHPNKDEKNIFNFTRKLIS